MTNGRVPEQTTLYHGQLFAQRPGVAPDDLSKCFLELGTGDRAGQEEWERKPECQRPKLSSRGTLSQRGQPRDWAGQECVSKEGRWPRPLT